MTRMAVPTTPPIDPAAKGTRVLLTDVQGGSMLDAIIPGGAGWTSNRAGTAWRYHNPGEAHGITLVRIRLLSAPGLLSFQVSGKRGAYGLSPAAMPIKGTLVIDSPVAQTGLLFYNTLFDENAASHVALGAAYKFTLRGGEGMAEEEFEQAGGNRSATHVDFMIGSSALDVDGVLPGGAVEPVMRGGEWI